MEKKLGRSGKEGRLLHKDCWSRLFSVDVPLTDVSSLLLLERDPPMYSFVPGFRKTNGSGYPGSLYLLDPEEPLA